MFSTFERVKRNRSNDEGDQLFVEVLVVEARSDSAIHLSETPQKTADVRVEMVELFVNADVEGDHRPVGGDQFVPGLCFDLVAVRVCQRDPFQLLSAAATVKDDQAIRCSDALK